MIFRDIWLDIRAVQERSLVARNALEVFLLYQGAHVLIWHRLAHWFYKHKIYFIVRSISQITRFFTLTEIHPGAQLGRGVLINRGSGVVIGETAVVGDNCTIYRGATLGGAETKKGERHPTLSDDVMVGAGTKILGTFEVGNNYTIATNAMLLEPLKDSMTAMETPTRSVKGDGITIPKDRRGLALEEYEDMKYCLEQVEKEMALLEDALAEENNAGGKGQCRWQETASAVKYNVVQQRGIGRIHGGNVADRRNEAPHVDIERSIIKQFRKEVWRPLVKGLQDYEMIWGGDKVAVCISRGKDSILLVKCLQQLERQSDMRFDLELIIMDLDYHFGNRGMIQDGAALIDIPVRIFDAGISDTVVNTDQSPCYPCARMHRGYLYSHTRELGYNKVALDHHFDDMTETILMGILYGGRINTMIPRLHNASLEGMELIRSLYYMKEEDILAQRFCNGLYFFQYACQLTEQVAREQVTGGTDRTSAGIVHASKRQGMKELIHSLRKNSPFVDSNIMRSTENINLDACLGYTTKGIRHRFMDKYDESQDTSISHLPSAQIL